MKTDGRIAATVKQVVQWLVEKDYKSLVAHTRGARIDEGQIELAIRRYGRTLVMPPESAWASTDIVEISGVDPHSWSVQFDLWTREEGRSDLTVELTLTENNQDLLDARLEDLRVL